MGTRSLTIFKDEGLDVAVLYNQWDGYPTGYGKKLSSFLKKFSAVTNGIDTRTKRKTANGMGCLAAQVIAHFKTEVGTFYLEPAGTRDAGEVYRYTVSLTRIPDVGENSAQILLTVESGYGEKWETLYNGPVKQYRPKKEKK